jgi:hypothetical protein
VVNTTETKPAKTLTVSLHWLTAVTKALDAIDAVGFITDYLGHGPVVHPTGRNGYTTTFEWSGGLKLLDNEKRPEMGVCLLADGDTCEYYGFDKLSHIYQALQFKATRIDLAADNCPFEPARLRDLWYQDSVRTVCKPMQDARAEFQHVRTCEWMTSPTGDTFYMGSRSSTQFARCYNSRGFTRFEMELKQERAAQIMASLCEGSPLASVLGSVINQFVSFVHLDDSNRNRCTALPFWKRFLVGLSDAGVVTRLDPKPERTIERLVDWIEGQVAPSLAVYEMVKGVTDSFDDVRRHLRRLGLERATSKHHALVHAAGGWHSSEGSLQINYAQLP